MPNPVSGGVSKVGNSFRETKRNETKKKPLLISSDFYSPSLSMNKMSFEPHWKVREAKETAS